MRDRWARIVTLGALLFAVATGPALALCSLESSRGCCCPAGCEMPQPDPRPSQMPECCTPQTPVPPASPLLPAPLPPPDAPPVVESADPGSDVEGGSRPLCAPGSNRATAPPLALFTLHAAFLI